MSQQVRSIRGMNDILPGESDGWLFIEAQVRELLEAYGYQHIRTPIVEYTDLFKRSIGDATDIVEKEMYTFEDRNAESLTLRPEATAGLVRAAITNSMTHNQKHKVWTSGPMFRYERPQKGRYRQFYQFGVEAFGYEGPDIDAEMIMLSARLWQKLGLSRISLELNSLGTSEARSVYRELLVEYFSQHKAQLDEDSQRRLLTNPMRILDSKNPQMAELIAGAPLLTEHLDEASREHFDKLCATLDAVGISYTINPRLVRGLDYYSRTVFEWVTDALGSQGAVCSGGRYDGLFEQLGAKSVPAIGWGMGIERLLALYIAEHGQIPAVEPLAYMVCVGDEAESVGVVLSEQLRDRLTDIALQRNLGGGSLKAQLKRAHKSGARFALIMGEPEMLAAQVTVKSLRDDAPQTVLARADLADWLADQ